MKRLLGWKCLLGCVLALVALGGLLFLGLIVLDACHPRDLLWAALYQNPWCDPCVPWEVEPCESHGLDPARLDALRDDLAARNTEALLIVRHNRVVYEWYASSFGPAERHYTASLAKALVGGTALLAAIDDGCIDLDDPAWQYIPAWKDDPLKSRITVRHLATHSSGLEDARPYPTGEQRSESQWKEAYWNNRPERFAIALSQVPVLFPPGSRLDYSNTGETALAYAITVGIRRGAQPNIRALLKARFMDPIGVPLSAWRISYGEAYRQDGMKLFVIGGGGNYTARAVARVGQLMLQKGTWEGRQLIEPGLVELATSDAGPADLELPPGHPAPGLGWWVNADDAWPSMPRDAFAGAGRDHQLLVVVPSLDLVVVRFGKALGDVSAKTAGAEYWCDVEEHLFRPLMEAVTDSAGPSF